MKLSPFKERERKCLSPPPPILRQDTEIRCQDKNNRL
jgi:hypothetical protein